MRRARGLPLLLPLMSGCAMQSASRVTSAPPSTTASASYSQGPPTREVTTSSGAGGTVADTPTPTPQMSSVPGNVAQQRLEGMLNDPDADRDTRIVQWEGELERQRSLLAASLAECRDICAAAGNVCTAAFEICRLTGDLPNGNARDGRCARARSACSDASRRRDGACPACPPR